MLKKLNVAHIALILALPIVLALINPNWIFNVHMVDDYIYLGYQLDFPKYVGWSPSSDVYFIERISVILPGYIIRDLFSPLASNFILHLSVYYGAIFAVYGIVNRLFNRKVALITALFFGQYPIILRATGWDYPDGYALAYFSLTIFFLTQSVGSRWRNVYLIAAGGAFILMINAHFFNVFYFPAIALYYLLINRWRNITHTFIAPVFWGGLGAGVVYGVLALIYYQATGRILFTNSINTADTNGRWLFFFLQFNFRRVNPHWHLFLIIVPMLVVFRPLLWEKLTHVPSDKPQFGNQRVILRALFGLFTFSYGMLALWQGIGGYMYIRVSYYYANIVMTAFLLLMALFAQMITHTTSVQFRNLVIAAFFMPMLPLLLVTLAPQQFLITNYYVFFIATLIATVVMMTSRRWSLYALCCFVMIVGATLNDSRTYRSHIYPAYHDVYNPDRLMNQTIYEYVVRIAQIINQRYDDLSYETFRFFFRHIDDTHFRLFSAVSSVYLYTWDRTLRSDIPEQVVREGNKTSEIVMLATVDNTQALIADLKNLLDVTEVERHHIPHAWGDIDLIFFKVNK